MKLSNLLVSVDERWRDAFLRFVETGEAEPDFLAYLDTDAKAQKAVDQAFTTQAAAFENLARELKATEGESKNVNVSGRTADTVKARVIAALQDAGKLRPDERKGVLDEAMETMRAVRSKANL